MPLLPTLERIALVLERIADAMPKPAPPAALPEPELTEPDGWARRVVPLPGNREKVLYQAPDGRQFTEVRRTEAGTWQARNGDRDWQDV